MPVKCPMNPNWSGLVWWLSAEHGPLGSSPCFCKYISAPTVGYLAGGCVAVILAPAVRCLECLWGEIGPIGSSPILGCAEQRVVR